MKKVKEIFLGIWNWVKGLFGKKAKPSPAPAAPLSGAALAEQLNKQSAAPLSGAALAEQLNSVSVPAPKKAKVTKKTQKKTLKKKA